MEFIPIKTRTLQPPQDDLHAVFDEYLTDLKENDVLVITSKIVSIHLGLCHPGPITDIHELTRAEADGYINNGATQKTLPLTIKHHTLLYRAGIDTSNSGDYYTTLPSDPQSVAKELLAYLKKTFSITNLGLIISDSSVLPFRRGVISVSIGSAGFRPYRKHAAGEQDLFGAVMVETGANLADALAAGSTLVCGEAAESTPLVIARGVTNITFTDHDNLSDYLIDPKRDLYTPLLEKFVTKDQPKNLVYIGLGANLDSIYGTPPQTLARAVQAIEAAGLLVRRVSPMYKTAPVPVSADPWYHNQVIALETSLSAEALLAVLNQTEAEFGRVRTVQNAPRVLDLDILSFGELQIESKELTIPHPRLVERAFVLYPLRDIAPDWRHPVTDLTVDQLISDLPEQAIEKIHD